MNCNANANFSVPNKPSYKIGANTKKMKERHKNKKREVKVG